MKKKWAFLPFICFILLPFFIRAFSFNSNGYVSRNSIEIFEKFTASRNIRIWLLSSVEKRNSRISVGCTIHPIFGIASCGAQFSYLCMRLFSFVTLFCFITSTSFAFNVILFLWFFIRDPLQFEFFFVVFWTLHFHSGDNNAGMLQCSNVALYQGERMFFFITDSMDFWLKI